MRPTASAASSAATEPTRSAGQWPRIVTVQAIVPTPIVGCVLPPGSLPTPSRRRRRHPGRHPCRAPRAASPARSPQRSLRLASPADAARGRSAETAASAASESRVRALRSAGPWPCTAITRAPARTARTGSVPHLGSPTHLRLRRGLRRRRRLHPSSINDPLLRHLAPRESLPPRPSPLAMRASAAKVPWTRTTASDASRSRAEPTRSAARSPCTATRTATVSTTTHGSVPPLG